MLRQRKLTEGWFFQCQCRRCRDPKELGAHTNTLRCPACRAESLLPTRPQNWEAPWKCAGCGAEQSAKVVEATVEDLLAEVNQLVETDRCAWMSLYTIPPKVQHRGLAGAEGAQHGALPPPPPRLLRGGQVASSHPLQVSAVTMIQYSPHF